CCLKTGSLRSRYLSGRRLLTKLTRKLLVRLFRAIDPVDQPSPVGARGASQCHHSMDIQGESLSDFASTSFVVIGLAAGLALLYLMPSLIRHEPRRSPQLQRLRACPATGTAVGFSTAGAMAGAWPPSARPQGRPEVPVVRRVAPFAAQSSAPAPARPGVCPRGHGTPLDIPDRLRVPIYTEEFAADPHAAYAEMRERFGSLVPVWLAPGVPATLVIGYWTALKILHDPEHFPADPRVWQRDIPAECPVKPMMQWRPNALRSSGIE